jgi:hypothetical protein
MFSQISDPLRFFSVFFSVFLGAQSAERRAQSADVFVFLFLFFQEGHNFITPKKSGKKSPLEKVR